jgi:3-oxoacyl-[acyl-carrier-protein] synthase II
VSKRVVITGLGFASPIGNSLQEVSLALREGKSGISVHPEWGKIDQLFTRLGGAVNDIEFKGRWPRKQTRTMGRVSLLSTFATENAIQQSGLDDDFVRSGKVGLAYGSTHGSTSSQEKFVRKLFLNDSLRGVGSTAYIKFMSHTCAANLAQFFGIRGRIHATCAACVSASQAIGYGYETVKHGIQDVMVCGGAEELHYLHAAVFDILYATSTKYNEQPELSPKPFDAHRDGLVVAEGAGTVVLETYEHARARAAPILGEIAGFGTNCDGTHVTSPSVDGMSNSMKLALKDAQLTPSDIDYINAHATATLIGDRCESLATESIFGSQTPVSSTKGATGHTLGACGAVELAFCLAMMNDGFVPPTRNLEEVDPKCGKLDYVMGEPRDADLEVCMSNNFAFGGIDTSLIIKKM